MKRTVIPRLIDYLNRAAPNYVTRHFTWLSATLVGVLVASNLFFVLTYVPGVTANRLLNIVLTFGTGLVMILTALGALITIHEKWDIFDQEVESSSGDTTSEGLSSPAQGFIRTDEDILKEALDLLGGWFSVSQRGEISLHPKEDSVSLDHKGMLYVIAKFTAHQAYPDEVCSPKVTRKELKNVLGFSTPSTRVFISKMSDFIIKNFDWDDVDSFSELDDEEVTIELNVPRSYQAAKYIIGERRAPN